MSKTDKRTAAQIMAGLYERYEDEASIFTADLLRRLDAENKALRGLAATCYAGLGAECNLPENWLDALKAAADGEPFDTEGLLPFTAAEAQNKALRERLEIDPSHPIDGIEARDETIRQLDVQIKELRIKAARYDYIKQFGTSGETNTLTHPRQVVYASIGFHGHELGAAIDARIAAKAAAKTGDAA